MKKHSKAKLKGTVLFTVISVMSLLIIFLTSTLVLATSASNRSHKNYAATQTEYTARAAIESFSEAMSRSDAVAQMIVNMKKTDVLTPSVEINDSALGEIGYYDNSGNWNSGQISIEYIDDTYVYNTEKSAWEEQQVLKVTATAELGGEESTVCAYIRKKSPDEPNPTSIRGLQTAGGIDPGATGGYYTGDFAIGLTNPDASTEYSIQNKTVIETDKSFINGSLYAQGGISINVSKLNSGTVIMGNLRTKNTDFIDINYKMTDAFNQKDIPYLFVNGNFTCESSLTIKDKNGKKSPYNIFCGSWDTWGKAVTINNSDLYLLDSGVTNRIGGTSSTKLSSWSNSLVQKGDTQFGSKGGSIYSKGNLEISDTTIYGDIRCEGNVTLGSNVKIYGDLVVNGALSGVESAIVNGEIYNGTTEIDYTGGLKPGYFAKNNTYYESGLKPGYYEYENPIYANYMAKNVQYANYVNDAKVLGIETTNNQPYVGDNFKEIILKRKSYWEQGYPQGRFADDEGNEYSDILIGNLDNSAVGIQAVPSSYSGEYNCDIKRIYQLDGNYISYPVYTDEKTGNITNNEHSYYLIYEDGTFTDIVPDDITIYQADMYGNKSDIVTDSFSVIYKVDKDGNPINEITDAPYTYYKVNKDGNPTDEQTTDYCIRYKVDGNGNTIDETTSEEFTYYKGIITKEEVTRDEAYGSNFYVEWCAPYGTTDKEVYYYKADPTGHETDETWLNDNRVTETDARAGNTVKPLSYYSHEIYPSSMTREAITGKDSSGKPYPDSNQNYKIVTSLDEMKEAIGYSSDFDSSIYYKEVPGGTDGFKTITVESNKTYTITENTILKSGTTSSGPVIINIKPGKQAVWVVFDNFTLADNDGHRIYVDDSQGGIVNFFVNGDFTANKIAMETASIKQNSYVYEDSKININWYGSVGSSINSTNEATFIGTAKMPYSKLNVPVSHGKYPVNYNGKIISPTWIGSGLFGEVKTSNNFRILHVDNANAHNNIVNELTGDSWEIMYYDMY